MLLTFDLSSEALLKAYIRLEVGKVIKGKKEKGVLSNFIINAVTVERDGHTPPYLGLSYHVLALSH